jgi:hypothetical protein
VDHGVGLDGVEKKNIMHCGTQTRVVQPVAHRCSDYNFSEIEEDPSLGVSEKGGYYMEVISVNDTMIYIS